LGKTLDNPLEEYDDPELPVPHPVTRSAQVQALLANELAAQLLPTSEVLNKFNLTKPQLKELLQNAQFKQMYLEAKAVWESGTNSKQRIAAKAAMMAEDSLLEIYGIIHDPDNGAPAKIDAFKQISTLADLYPKKESEGGSGEKFSITINLPEQTSRKPIVLEAEIDQLEEFENE
jgi:hypothetical protein